MKGKNIDKIEHNINLLLDNLSINSVHKIQYHYDKDAKLEGDYSVLSLSTIFLWHLKNQNYLFVVEKLSKRGLNAIKMWS